MSDYHWYDNDSTLGLGLGMIMLSRRHARQKAAEAPYKEAEFAAWWAGLTPVQQAAYNESLARRQHQRTRPIRQPSRFAAWFEQMADKGAAKKAARGGGWWPGK